MTTCKQCRSYAINLNMAGRDASEPGLCDVCYWRGVVAAKDAELAGYVEANRYMKGELEDAIEDARKYAEAKGEIASLRTALDRLLCATEGHDVCPYAKAEARYVLTPEGK